MQQLPIPFVLTHSQPAHASGYWTPPSGTNLARRAAGKRFSVMAMVLLVLGLELAVGPQRVLAQRPLGVDVSDHQPGIDWSSVKASGITFAWAKATEATGYFATTFAPNEINGKAAGVYIGAYDFARPDLVSPTAEAAYFWSIAGSYIKPDGRTLMPMLDFETFDGCVGASSYADWANEWCNTIMAFAAAQGITVRPVIYTTTAEACYLNSNSAQWIPWIANPSGENAQTGSPWDYTSYDYCNLWGGWTVWQYSWSGSVPGISVAVDLDVYNGNLSSLISTLVIGTPPVITNPPVSLVCTQGNPAAFTVVAGPAPLNYQWRKNGGDVSGATASALTLAGVTTNDAASYTVMVNNLAGSVTSAVATLTVLAPPAITIEPQSSGLCQGAPAALTLGATGTAPLFYQWRWNSFSFAPGTGGSPCTVYNPGSYSCVVSNRVGMVTSDVAVLSVTYPPAITNPLPAAAVVVQGSCSNLSVGAGGTAPVYYQWHWNSTAFSASTAASAWSACSAGSYWCVLSNSCGMATSAVTVLSVVMPPVVTSQPQSRTNLAGWGSLMSVGASGTGPLYYQWHWNDTVYPPDTASSLMAYNAGSYWVGISNLSGMGTQSATALLVLTNALPGRFEAIERLSDGSVALRMSGTAGTNYTLLWTRDWSNWSTLARCSVAAARSSTTDPWATNHGQRFYRLRLGL